MHRFLLIYLSFFIVIFFISCKKDKEPVLPHDTIPCIPIDTAKSWPCLEIDCDLNAASNDPNRPNIFIVNFDDLGWFDLGIQGHPYIKTPFIDSIANNGINMTCALGGNAICSPSRASLMTGLASQYVGVPHSVSLGHNYELPKEEITIAEILEASGYSTWQTGKWHLSQAGGNSCEHGFKQCSTFTIQRANKTLNVSRSFLQNAVAEGKPIFGYIDIHEPHLPLNKFYRSGYTDSLIIANQYDQVSLADFQNIPRKGVASVELTEEDIQYYFAAITAADEYLRQFFNYARSIGAVNDNTIIIITSDNGPAFSASGSPGNFSGSKTDLYLGGLKVPFIISWPQNSWNSGTSNNSIISHYDIFPTLASIAGADECFINNRHGEDISSIIDGTKLERDRGLYYFFLGGNQRRPYPTGDFPTSSSLNDVATYIHPNGLKIMAGLECLSKDILVNDWINNGKYVDYQLYDINADPLELNPLPMQEEIFNVFWRTDCIRRKRSMDLESRRHQVNTICND